MKPITPKKAREIKNTLFPPEIISSFNELIAENLNTNNRSTFSEDSVLSRILEKMPDVTKEQICANKWLDVENVFRKHGWYVTYNSPAYNETWLPYFTFTGKSK